MLTDSLRAIENAERKYDALSDNEKLLVSNHDALVRARKAYDSLASASVSGDADGDGLVSSKDLILIRRFLSGYDFDTGTTTVKVFSGADVNADGEINSKDVTALRRYLADYDYGSGASGAAFGLQ